MRSNRARARFAAMLEATGITLGGLACAAVFVRLSLDWSDSQPYAGQATETRYIVFLLIAVAIAASGLGAGIWAYRRRLKRH